MLSKRPRPYDDDVPAAKRLAANVRDLYAMNTVSCRRTQMLINDMHAAGVADLPAPVNSLEDTHLARKLRGKMTKWSLWPKDYEANVRLWNRTTEEEEIGAVAMLLPHEVLEMMFKFGLRSKLYATSNMDPLSAQHLAACEQKSGAPRMVGYGLHCDGVPHSWDRVESCEVFSFNLPGIEDAWKNMRIPLFALPHWAIGPNTWNDLMAIMAWSMSHMWQGVHPLTRHDKTAFAKAEKSRVKNAGKQLAAHACLTEIRGDWKMFAETFALPRWNNKEGCCWSCYCKTHEVPQLISMARSAESTIVMPMHL